MQTYKEDSLAKAINKLVNELIGDLKLDIRIDSSSDLLEANIKNEIYLIVREAVTNIQLHAQAERAMVTIETHPNRINLFVQDDGRGISLGSITKKPEGLIRIQECVKRLGAGHEMDSSNLNGGGVAHWIYIPLPIAKKKTYETTTRINFMPSDEASRRRDWGGMNRIWIIPKQ